MSTRSRFNDEARGELLCYLVVGELVAMARTGNWLKTGHTVELAHIWMNANGARSDWQERIAVTRVAADLAPDVRAASRLLTEKPRRRYSRTDGVSMTGCRSSARSMTCVWPGAAASKRSKPTFLP